jgi:peroxiredoxin
MAKTPSTMLDLGTVAPDFSLPDAWGHTVSLKSFADAPALLVMFICNHCPYVKHIAGSLAATADEYMSRGVAVVAVNSNDYEKYPDDAPAKMQEEITIRGYKFPYLVDASQEVAKAYKAACTPDFYLFGSDRRLVYRGQWDASRPGNDIVVDGAHMRAALDAVLAGKPVPADQIPSIGCNIKWKSGNAPAYFG